MSLALDLLEQARHLSKRERRRPRQASLRRAISAAYYAMFHLLTQEASASLVARPDLRARFSRAFDHGDMKQASRAFANAQPAQLLGLTGGAAVPSQLQDLAEAFVELQEARHEADYNTDRSFTRLESINLVARAAAAFASWQAIRTDPVARTYLAALLLWKRWHR
ncbi:MAG TPA: hypothetical protein VG269_04495 [Tepidisphaeraceae bacterium]|jgi:uncharacterized protein (UPF0332 family)|nr:hypothetical protein [Tepidisphaeraceae bacterium]